MPRYRIERGKQVAFSEAEETARDAEEKAWADSKATRDIKKTIKELEAEVTPRRLREAILGTDSDWLKNKEAEITSERSKL